jgi:hypothetical protein
MSEVEVDVGNATLSAEERAELETIVSKQIAASPMATLHRAPKCQWAAPCAANPTDTKR